MTKTKREQIIKQILDHMKAIKGLKDWNKTMEDDLLMTRSFARAVLEHQSKPVEDDGEDLL